MSMTLAAKCAPDEKILTDIQEADIQAVELFTNLRHLQNLKEVKQRCSKFPFRYAVHAPNEGFEIAALAELVDDIKAEIVVFHNIYWEDEWEQIIKAFEGVRTKICLENTSSVLDPLKFIRRYGMGLCLDLEHLQIECAGFFEESFVPFIKQASHIHLTGYTYGSNLWHTHIHKSPEHSRYIMNLIKKTNYTGFIVSEAKTSLQSYQEFKELRDFISSWNNDEI